MAEFPTLGQHCAHLECGQLDFLPIKCYGCSQMFCAAHYTYEAHKCLSGLHTNTKMPICPLCNQPVPTPAHRSPEETVAHHIDRDCRSEVLKPIYVNVCSLKRCKRQELVAITCDKCRRNFCIKHRHFDDHSCTGMKPNPELRSLELSQSPSSVSSPSQNESDEELARKLHNLLNVNNQPMTSEEMDQRLAERLQREEYDNNAAMQMWDAPPSHTRTTGQCCIS